MATLQGLVEAAKEGDRRINCNITSCHSPEKDVPLNYNREDCGCESIRHSKTALAVKWCGCKRFSHYDLAPSGQAGVWMFFYIPELDTDKLIELLPRAKKEGDADENKGA